MESSRNWKQKGNLFLWRYEPFDKNFPGWHLTGDSEGLDSILELLGRFEFEAIAQHRTIRLNIPGSRQYSIPNCRSKGVPTTKLVVTYSSNEGSSYTLTQENDKALMVVNSGSIPMIKNHIGMLLNNDSDISIGSNGNQLWVW